MEGAAKRASVRRPKKRRYFGNQHETLSVNEITELSRSFTGEKFLEPCDAVDLDLTVGVNSVNTPKSSSARKLSCPDDEFVSQTSNRGANIIINRSLIFEFLEQNVSCKLCGGDIKVDDDNLFGLSVSIFISCTKCLAKVSTKNSASIGERNNAAEINLRIVYAMRCIGQGLESLKTFCGIMDFDSPISQKAYEKICHKIKDASKATAVESMIKATEEEVQMCGSTDITVSGDGTWKTMGHTSQIGVCTVIGADTGKVLDVDILSLSCKGCESWKGPRSGNEFSEWTKKHSSTCTKNHSGSSGA